MKLCDFEGRCDWKKLVRSKFSHCISVCLNTEVCKHSTGVDVKKENVVSVLGK